MGLEPQPGAAMGVVRMSVRIGLLRSGLLALCLMLALPGIGLANGLRARSTTTTGWAALPNPPKAVRIESTTRLHGEALIDEYAWLRAPNWEEAISDPDTLPRPIRAYIDAENRYARRSMAPTQRLQAELLAEMRARIEANWSSPPLPDGRWEYFDRHAAGLEHPHFLRRPRGGGREQLLLDANRLSRNAAAFELAGVRHSPDHRHLAYAADTTGNEDFTIRFRDLATGRDLPDVLPGGEDLPVWAADSRTVFYALRHSGKALTIKRHRLGTLPASDAVVYQEEDPAFLLTLGRTTSGRFVVITAADSRTDEIRVVDAERPQDPPRLIIPRQAGERHEIAHHGNRFFIRTNADGRRDFRIVEAPVAAPEPASWREIVPHREGVSIQAMQVTARHIARLERHDGHPRIVVRRLADGEEHAIAFDASQPHTLAMVAGHEHNTDVLRFTHETMRRPQRVFDYNMETRARQLRRTQVVPSGHSLGRFETRRILAPAADGEQVPISLLHARGLRLDGRAPLLLHGYGAYGTATDPTFDPNVLSLIERGFVYAIAHVRGGGELGERWREAGMLSAKINSFRDFIAAAEHLARSGYTSRGRIVAMGTSAGGLLVAGAANMRPDLFMGLIAQSPFVDAVNTLIDASLPLTPTEWNEWGNPAASRGAFETIRAYSPYDNVTAQAYPAILVTASLTDPRVTYWEPVKWVARLRAQKRDNNPLLLLTEAAAGHDGPSGRFEKLKSTAQAYAFAIQLARRLTR